MALDERHRIRFHDWLVAHGLAPEVADAILVSMPPFDWDDIARRADLDAVDTRLDRVETRLDRVETRLDHLGDRMELRFDGMTREIRLVLLTLVGFMLTVVLAVTTTALG